MGIFRGKNKRGSFSIFIVMAFSSILILVFAILLVSEKLAVSSVTDSFGRLWGRSILAEYDVNLKDRYGLFAFYSDGASTESKLDFYANYTFGTKKYVSYDGSTCQLKAYQLTNIDNIKGQIKEAVIYLSEPKAFVAKEEIDGTYGKRKISSQWILKSLPSAEINGESNVTTLVNQIKNGISFDSLVGTVSINSYIFTYFKDNQNERDLGKTYFQNEIEYIISGKPDDQKALSNVENKLLLMRNMLNLYYLYQSSEKREAALAMATLILPGPQVGVVQMILLEAWAYAEAKNDIKLLQAGEKVPLLKKDQNWAISLRSIVSNVEEVEDLNEVSSIINGGGNKKNYVKPQTIEGVDYSGYLKILLNTLAEDTRVLRAMDLIQINMKYLYCDYFLLEDYYVGVSYTLKVNGVEHDFEEVY